MAFALRLADVRESVDFQAMRQRMLDNAAELESEVNAAPSDVAKL